MFRIDDGSPAPLGATFDGRGVNFALFSANATGVELCLFDPKGDREIERVALPRRTDQVWHVYVDGLVPGQLYGYRVHGPYDPRHGHRFNPHKLLIDPYARQLYGRIRWHEALFGYRMASDRCAHPGPPRQRAEHAEMRRRGSVASIGVTTARRAARRPTPSSTRRMSRG